MSELINLLNSLNASNASKQQGKGIVFSQDKNGLWYWRVESNWRTLCHSESYSSKQAAENGVRALIQVIKDLY